MTRAFGIKPKLPEIPKSVIVDNDSEWNGDHCMDHTTVPGILLSNRALKKPVTALKNLAAAVVAEFGLDGFPAQGSEKRAQK